MAITAYLIDEKGYLKEPILLSPNQIWQMSDAAKQHIVMTSDGNPSAMQNPRWNGKKWVDESKTFFQKITGK